jgi:Flp pilus assembly pilin Flp
MPGWFDRFSTGLSSEKGAALAEWGLLVVLIAIVALIALTAAGTEVSETYSDISSAVSTAGT